MTKSFEELEFCDDFMFGKVVEDSELCRRMLEVLLQRPVGILKPAEVERRMRFISDGKEIRMDLYTEETGKNHEEAVRYQSKTDLNRSGEEGNMYHIPKTNVVFLCTIDPFRAGKPVYRQDRGHKLFFNSTYTGDDIPEEMRLLYRYIQNGEVSGKLTYAIQKRVNEVKQSEEWRSGYLQSRLCEEEIKYKARKEGIAQGLKEGIVRGRREGKAEERIRTEQERRMKEAAYELLRQNGIPLPERF